MERDEHAYQPWRDVRARAEVEVVVTTLPAGVRALHARSDDGFRCILIDRRLTPAERRAALAHELVHDEAGGGCHRPGMPDLMRPLVARDEARVDRIAADRLLPVPQLASWVAREVAAGRSVVAASVAAELDVAPWVAELQLRRLPHPPSP